MTSILLLLLTKLTDRALAESIVGDLAQERHRRARRSRTRATFWFAGSTTAIVWRAATGRIRDIVVDLSLRRLGVSGIVGEVRQALRALRRTPVATAVIVATLALGIGVNTAVYSVVYGVLFQPLPFADPDRIVMLEGATGDRPPSIFGNSLEDFRDLARDARTFAGLGAAGYWTFNLTDLDVPQRIVGAAVSGRFFETLGTKPVLGRFITEADDHAGAPVTFVISHGLWQRQFGGRAEVIGREIRPNGLTATIVGVMPASFRFPGEDVEIWTAIRNEMDGTPRNVRFWAVFGRLAPKATIEQAGADVGALAHRLEEIYPNTNRGWRVTLVPALDALTTRARDGLLLLFAAVLVVFAVAVINVAGLLASRHAARGRELAVRVAVGATTPRLMRGAMLEGAWLGIAGLTIGLAVAVPTVSLLRASAPASLPRAADIGLHWPVLWLAACSMALLIVASGCVPLVRAARRRRTLDVREGGLGRASTPRTAAGTGLVVVQIALAFVLLAGAALLMRSFMRVTAVDPGFRPDHLVTMRVFLGPPTYRTIELQRQFTDRALDVLRQTAGVTRAGAISQPPFDTEGGGTSQRFVIDGQEYESGAQPSLNYRTADAGYLEAMGLRLIGGRWLTRDDRPGSPDVVVVNQIMARRFFPDRDPIGARIQWVDTKAQGPLTIVGVVGDIATNGLERAETPVAYGPYSQRPFPFLRWLTFVARVDGDPEAAAGSIRAAVQSVDPRQPIFAVRTMDQIVARSLAERRFSLLLMAAFAGLTVVLATLGLYGMLAQRVELRRREIGVRMSLGATGRRVFGLVVRQGLTIVAVGLALGVAASYAMSGLMESLVFGITPEDGTARVVVALLVASVGLIACLIPARRASRVDPIVTLK
ncbi:MAG TPA: ABC transporter permease [Vicinamibacterales bacterium]|nr:ABC transporter permease [Vicinamibacterales bacterium]